MERITYQEVPSHIFEKQLSIEELLRNISLDFSLLELLRLRIAQMNGCAYCADMHYKELRHAGESELRISQLCAWKEAPCFSEKERAVLFFTESLTKLSTEPLPDEVYDPLTKHFSKSEICYLTLAISQMNTWTRFMKTFRFTPGLYHVKQVINSNLH